MMHTRPSLGRSRRGDSIVEVLIAIIVVSGVLGAAFVTLSNGQESTRSSQERSEAVKLSETQVEYLRELQASDKSAFAAIGSSDVCLAENTGSITVVSTLPSPDCTHGSIPGGYRVSIREDTSASDLYNVRVEWDGIDDSGLQVVEMKYRLQP